MGFHKRVIDKEIIQKYLNNKKDLKKLFNADALIFSDNLSSKIYDLVSDGKTNEEVKFFFNQNKYKL